MPETILIQGANISLDLLLWRRYGDPGQALLTIAYALNPGLAALGPIIPAGTTVILPDAPVVTAITATPVDLFG